MTSAVVQDPHGNQSPRITSSLPFPIVKALAIAAVAYMALGIALTWPLAAHLTTHLPHDLGDPVLSSWILWWHAHHVPFTATWWDGAGFFPAHGTLALSDHRVGLSLIGSPLIWLGGSAVLAYNVALLLSFALSALSMYFLVWLLSRRHEAAALAGVVFGFAPYRFDHVVHIEIVSSYWLPMALAGLHLWLRTRQLKWLALFGVSWLMQALTCGYYFFYFSILLGLWVVWFLRSWRREILPVAVAGVATLLPILPVLLRYKSIHDEFGLKRGIREIELFSADISGLMSGAPWLAGSSISTALFKPEGQIYPGLVAVLLVLLAVVASLRRESRQPRRRARLVLLGSAVVALGVAASVPILGPWRLNLGSLTVSVSQAFKPLSVGVFALVAYALTSPAFVAAYRRQSPFVFYAVATLGMWTLAFGPSPQLFGDQVLYKAPYAWLMALPAFSDGLRVPARFAMLASLCLAVAAGLALTRLLTRRPLQRLPAAGVTAALVLLMVAEVWSGPGGFPLVRAPAPLAIPDAVSRALGRNVAVVELPLGGVEEDTIALYHSMAHDRPVLNGYSGYDPPHYALLRMAVRAKDTRGLTAVGRYASLLIVVHQDRDRDDEWENYVRGIAGATLLARSSEAAFYLVPQQRDDPTGTTPPSLPTGLILASEAQEAVTRIRDERLETLWISTGPQKGGEQFLVELDEPRDVCGISLALGPALGAYPRALDIAVSADRQAWTTAWTGPGAGLAVEAALRDPKRLELQIETTRQPAMRFIKLTQLGRSDEDPWAIAELTIVGCAK
jgi:hypothetical protein